MTCGPGFTDFTPFLARIVAAAPGLPDVAAHSYLRDAAIRFCEASGWLEREARLSMACGVRDYPVVPADCERVVRVVAVAIDCGTPEGRWADDGMLDPRRDVIETGCGFRVEALETPDVSVWIDREGDACDRLRVRYVAAPRHDACRLDARLAEEWGRALVEGALADVLLLPGHPFSAPRLAVVYGQRFDAAILRARTRRLRGRTGGARTMVPERGDFAV
ncbi:MAG: hypothetical protein ACOY82_08860 [Pseudomonadota bacterium]